ncbi:hypothetical protein BD410DRAFT_845408 [Rickenella mellea]|uniref:DUF6534 domain-containing protein n=1 Tax=Rickenella mellea TaxID=50990 RepID=A0A4Y7PK29_9AGAM|nr:hypothetical protein BD410DRAFT_845408 [Rickenella mellea]
MVLSALDLNLGALEIGVLISSVLFGVTSVQVYMYWHQRFNDRLAIQALVAAIWIFETVHTVFLWIYLYRLTVTFYGVPAVFAESSWELNMSGFFDGIINCSVQAFFAYRVLAISRNWTVPIISWSGSLLQMTGTFAITALGFTTNIESFAAKYSWIVRGTLVTDAIVDTINTVALCYYLSRGRTGFHATDRIVDTIILWTIETGLTTTVAALLMLVFDISLSKTAMWISVSFFVAKLYSNSLLAVLNGRHVFRGQSEGVTMALDTIRSGSQRLEISVVRAGAVETDAMPHFNQGKDTFQKYQPNFPDAKSDHDFTEDHLSVDTGR